MTATERRLAALEPEFKAKIEVLLGELEIQGIKCVVTSARRTMAEQAKLYAQGRSTHGAIVTKAPAGSSPHNFGLAADLCPLNPAGELWWTAPDDVWQVIALTAKNNGLVSGYYFRSIKDNPHVEAPEWKIAQSDWRAGKITVA